MRVDAISRSTPRNAAFYLNQGLSGLAAAVGAGAARSLVGGSSFGDNIIAALPDVIGSTIGNAIGDAVAGASSPGGAPTAESGEAAGNALTE